MSEIEARKARAVALLTEWLREEDPLMDLVDSIHEAAEHLSTCNGQDRTCAGVTDECGDSDPQDCAHCATDCEDCAHYRLGYQPHMTWGTRPLRELVEELRERLERREESVA